MPIFWLEGVMKNDRFFKTKIIVEKLRQAVVEKKLSEKENKRRQKVEKIEKDGFLISKKLLKKESNRICPVCEIYSFEIKDNMYMTKFSCCYLCYKQFVEQREDRWNSGWRPDKNEVDKRRFGKDD